MKSINKVVDEPFILASEASQVFYSTDLSPEGWSVVLHSSQKLTSAVDKLESPTVYQSTLNDNESLEDLICVIMAAPVEVDEIGLPISVNATKLGHIKGALVRTHVPISYETWRKVPDKYKDDVWNELKMSFDLPETSKTIMVNWIPDPWRRFKCELRQDHYDIWNTHQERIDNNPPSVKSEDWIKFCEHENNAAVQSKKAANNKKREQYDYSHTSGRKPHCLMKAEL
ncbi:uncharacterized protein LOC113348997 [Papaver somniferum]|uniref:uncharacterized protein LOC113348997 n=1 Tax=Papaver somniferum TaxID=3469 RepID=UPI000E703B9B|nr:uncharacterized protein LOC113348997 [Papaver somniferum]